MIKKSTKNESEKDINKPSSDAKQKRLAEALRANLRRRKGQAQARKENED